MHETVPYWEQLEAGDPAIPQGPWGDQPQWGWGFFGRERHFYIFYCGRCPNPADGTPRSSRPRKTAVDSYKFVNVYVREAVASGAAELDVSRLTEW